MIRSSEGRLEIGQGGGRDASVEGSAGGMETEENEAMSSDAVEAAGPSRGWWVESGLTVAVLDGFRFVDFELKDDGGKCLFL